MIFGWPALISQATVRRNNLKRWEGQRICVPPRKIDNQFPRMFVLFFCVPRNGFRNQNSVKNKKCASNGGNKTERARSGGNLRSSRIFYPGRPLCSRPRGLEAEIKEHGTWSEKRRKTRAVFLIWLARGFIFRAMCMRSRSSCLRR